MAAMFYDDKRLVQLDGPETFFGFTEAALANVSCLLKRKTASSPSPRGRPILCAHGAARWSAWMPERLSTNYIVDFGWDLCVACFINLLARFAVKRAMPGAAAAIAHLRLCCQCPGGAKKRGMSHYPDQEAKRLCKLYFKALVLHGEAGSASLVNGVSNSPLCGEHTFTIHPTLSFEGVVSCTRS